MANRTNAQSGPVYHRGPGKNSERTFSPDNVIYLMIVKIGDGADRNFGEDVNHGCKFGALSYKQPAALQKSVRRFSRRLFSPNENFARYTRTEGRFFAICGIVVTLVVSRPQRNRKISSVESDALTLHASQTLPKQREFLIYPVNI